jgi:glycosyltransferase involved in cell wall biosynthesis
VAAARNMGLSHSTADYVVTCDADDVMLPRAIEALEDLATARHDLDILCRTAYYARDGEIVALARTPEKPRFPIDDQRVGILRENFVPGHAAVRRERLIDVGAYDEDVRAAVDYEAWVRLIFAGARAGLLLDPLHIYVLRPGSLSTHSTWRLQGCITAMVKVIDRTDLSPAERRTALERLRHLNAELVWEQAKEALGDRRPDARRRCFRVVFGDCQPARKRAQAGVGALAPRWTGQRLQRRASLRN